MVFMKILTQSEYVEYRQKLKHQGYCVIESTTIVAKLCNCGSGWYVDRIRNTKEYCQKCDIVWDIYESTIGSDCRPAVERVQA